MVVVEQNVIYLRILKKQSKILLMFPSNFFQYNHYVYWFSCLTPMRYTDLKNSVFNILEITVVSLILSVIFLIVDSKF